jgi:hypothetical protein
MWSEYYPQPWFRLTECVKIQQLTKIGVNISHKGAELSRHCVPEILLHQNENSPCHWLAA